MTAETLGGVPAGEILDIAAKRIEILACIYV